LGADLQVRIRSCRRSPAVTRANQRDAHARHVYCLWGRPLPCAASNRPAPRSCSAGYHADEHLTTRRAILGARPRMDARRFAGTAPPLASEEKPTLVHRGRPKKKAPAKGQYLWINRFPNMRRAAHRSPAGTLFGGEQLCPERRNSLNHGTSFDENLTRHAPSLHQAPMALAIVVQR